MVCNLTTPVLCPTCNSPLKVRDSKKRIIKDSSSNQYIFSLRRLYCSHCHQLHTEFPDFIAPYKQYSQPTIEAVLSGKIDYFAGDDSTVAVWKKQNQNNQNQNNQNQHNQK